MTDKIEKANQIMKNIFEIINSKDIEKIDDAIVTLEIHLSYCLDKDNIDMFYNCHIDNVFFFLECLKSFKHKLQNDK